MEVAYQDARLLQASTCVNWRDHAPVKLVLLYGDWHPDKEEKPARWDKVHLVTALSSPTMVAPLRRDLDEWAGSPPVQDALQTA
eukprot:11974844-Heterocapsa_arctica.AAC.1